MRECRQAGPSLPPARSGLKGGGSRFPAVTALSPLPCIRRGTIANLLHSETIELHTEPLRTSEKKLYQATFRSWHLEIASENKLPTHALRLEQ
ncbi:hypothetical protein NDU88_006498 [Pleurodeles waltl]|uniref:Uncharacterized protein n=1 Tax=Pleurodeles waltl TaxID=8319 RepID=A0AAV7UMA6_PLEWA|nr:hypothetical protein NDU88_006498 [Pleurodeles waltl]